MLRRPMIASIASAFADLSLAELALIAGMALIASVVGGVAGYGTGALMPLVLVPIVGAEPVVPILSISALFTNTSRAAAFRQFDRSAPCADRARRRGADLRARCLGLHHAHRQGRADRDRRDADRERAAAPADAAARARALRPRAGGGVVRLWGPLAGGTVGAGIILLSLLMAAGLQGAAVVATDAAISIGIGLTKLAVFGLAGAVSAKVIAIALLIGCVAFPGAFLAEALVARLPLHVHTAILDAVVIGGGAVMVITFALSTRVSRFARSDPATASAHRSARQVRPCSSAQRFTIATSLAWGSRLAKPRHCTIAPSLRTSMVTPLLTWPIGYSQVSDQIETSPLDARGLVAGDAVVHALALAEQVVAGLDLAEAPDRLPVLAAGLVGDVGDRPARPAAAADRLLLAQRAMPLLHAPPQRRRACGP